MYARNIGIPILKVSALFIQRAGLLAPTVKMLVMQFLKDHHPVGIVTDFSICAQDLSDPIHQPDPKGAKINLRSVSMEFYTDSLFF
jgi:hypothetical protein